MKINTLLYTAGFQINNIEHREAVSRSKVGTLNEESYSDLRVPPLTLNCEKIDEISQKKVL